VPEPDLRRRLTEIAADLCRGASPVAAWPLMDGIERRLVDRFVRPERSGSPVRVAEARIAGTTKRFKATDHDAQRLERRDLHRLLRGRVEERRRVVRRQRDQRWPEPRLPASGAQADLDFDLAFELDLDLVGWLRLIDDVGRHAEVAAVNEALRALEGRRKKGDRAPLRRIEVGGRGSDPVEEGQPHCADCAFLLDGVRWLASASPRG
jgi:hypothetical protein